MALVVCCCFYFLFWGGGCFAGPPRKKKRGPILRGSNLFLDSASCRTPRWASAALPGLPGHAPSLRFSAGSMPLFGGSKAKHFEGEQLKALGSLPRLWVLITFPLCGCLILFEGTLLPLIKWETWRTVPPTSVVACGVLLGGWQILIHADIAPPFAPEVLTAVSSRDRRERHHVRETRDFGHLSLGSTRSIGREKLPRNEAESWPCHLV